MLLIWLVPANLYFPVLSVTVPLPALKTMVAKGIGAPLFKSVTTPVTTVCCALAEALNEAAKTINNKIL